jgi:hypothetical protein
MKPTEIERRPVKPRVVPPETSARAGQRETFRRMAEGRSWGWTRPVNAPERSAAVRRSASFAERGLTGRDPRPYPPAASEWLGCSHREAYRWSLRFFLPEVFLEPLAGSLDVLHDTANDLTLLLGSKINPSRAADPLLPSRPRPCSRPSSAYFGHRKGVRGAMPASSRRLCLGLIPPRSRLGVRRKGNTS